MGSRLLGSSKLANFFILDDDFLSSHSVKSSVYSLAYERVAHKTCIPTNNQISHQRQYKVFHPPNPQWARFARQLYETKKKSNRADGALVSMAKLPIKELSPVQERVIHCFLEKHDVFAAMPTGYGKSYCFEMLPHIYEYLGRRKSQLLSSSLFHIDNIEVRSNEKVWGCLLRKHD